MPEHTTPPPRVLDLTDGLAFQGARLLVGMGADVVRVDPGEDLDAAARIHWHAGKRWVRLTGERVLDELAAGADVVLESGPVAALRGVRADGTSRWPHAVHVVVTPFGLTGPHRDRLADDLVLASAGGMTWLGGRADGPPKPPPREQAVQVAGAHAAIAALLGVLARDRTGAGQLIDISGQEAVAATLETGAIAWIHAGRFPVRNGGVFEHVAHRIFAASDGFVAGGYSGSNRMWTDLLAWMVEEGEAADLVDGKWSDPVVRWQGRPYVDEVVARFVGKRGARAVAEEGRARALPWAEVVPPAQLTENPQLRDREFFVSVVGDDLPGVVEDAGFPWEAPRVPRPVRLHALHETPARRAWTHTEPRGRRPRPSGARALDGVRVLDLTWVLAGPYVTKQLAEHGAEIVKIESRHRQDPTRFSPSMRLREGAGPDDSAYFLNFNRGKRSVALNLRTAEGVRLLRELVPHCDVVVENFSPGVLAKWGMDYASLRELNPDVVLVSMAGVGQTGPWRHAVTFADTLAAMSGLSSETRDPGGPPQGLTFGLGDMVAGNAAVLATLTLLADQRGGHVDLSQLEAMAASIGPAVAEAAFPPAGEDHRTPEQPNRSVRAVPHGVYPAAGEDRWVAVAVLDDAQWRALVGVTGGLGVPAAADLAARRAAEDAIDAALAGWTAQRDPVEAAAALQAAGVPAALVATGQDLVDRDEHLAARGFYPVLEHPIAGPVRHEGIVARLGATPGALTSPAPLLGQDTTAVLTDLLGLDETELAALAAAGVTE
ncbi:crotonobetainyl-CoA:carnitine CoA-transferase CaiB-like acyl-CoA transferase [Pseudonocardia hierapolitana]|uniref:Crotonobetainyl-CoA:carnitine CoA-transferase CaiB-like acyl-CoA transferase n=1 Tax=Pseudonocardia hierapolitana TaxID=1128676 RepID=A0A561SJV7_9PSEU|nr:CoA transferase [Pseudonocardia hierapolitana]TWF75102.1 crotonobetainyl-CoA:carnitine CoA-transferase CaiB-like acyl-CoA transferase [Pseudonocardia hierapolitana]